MYCLSFEGNKGYISIQMVEGKPIDREVWHSKDYLSWNVDSVEYFVLQNNMKLWPSAESEADLKSQISSVGRATVFNTEGRQFDSDIW